ncbi:serine/threonine-protein kinase [Pseudosporangium ferrugineum]|nr:serine/threonine-protein kinase [Pseudosporangium ferrugineum]
MSTTDLPGSSLLAGRYRLVERLGAGGMSVVWRGFDEVLGRQVAVKVLPPSTSADPSFRRRLRAEAQAAARLSHPHITNVYDYGEATTVDGEPVPYVVMELVDGESLAAVLARAQRLPWPAAVRICAEVSAALAAAHARGIVHRDVTPANVMLTPAGAKVVDFGISALIGENDIDPDGSLLGTPAYLAPERLEGGQVSPATDVYAVGLLIYRTLIGQLPWDVGTTTALLRAHQYTEPEPMPPVEGLPAAVSALIARCLEKRPSDRPSSAELAHVLGTVSAGVPAARAFVPDWADSGEDTTILPSARSYTDGLGRLRPGHARVGDPATPGRGVAAVPPAAGGSPEAPAAGSPAEPISVVETEAPVGANSAPAVAPPQRGGRNSRFGPVPPMAPAAGGAAAPPMPPGPLFGGPDVGMPAAGGPDDGPALRPAFGAAPDRPPARPDAQAAGGVPPTQRPGGPSVADPRPGGRPGGTRRRGVAVFAGAAVLVVSGVAWALAMGAGDPPQKVVANGVGPQPTQVAGANKCVVSYAVWSDDGGRFKAAITIANRDVRAIKNWNLWFLMPGDQVVSGNGKLGLDQQARAVTVNSRRTLNPQATETMQFTGRYKASNAAPMVFKLDGQTCETFVSPKPGEPSRPVEHLDNGTIRLGPVPVKDTPIPGISIAPGGVAVPVPVPTTVSVPEPRPSTPTGTSTGTGSPTTTGTDDDDAPPPEPPPTGTTPPTTPPTSLDTTTTPPPMQSDDPDAVDTDAPPPIFG